MRLRVIDIETTGQEPPAEVIEFGRVDLHDEGDAWQVEAPLARLYRPLNGIPPETMAVHHITLEEVGADAAVCTEERLRKAVWAGVKPDILVAHNCAFERLFINDDVCGGLPWVCVSWRIWWATRVAIVPTVTFPEASRRSRFCAHRG